MTMINEYSAPPIELTRQHLQEIGKAWLAFGKAKAADVEAKLPPALKRMLAPMMKPPAAPVVSEPA